MLRAAFFVVVLGAVAGCAAGPSFDTVRASLMTPRLQQRGYSVARPTTDDWLLIRQEQTPEVLIFRRDAGDSERSVFVSVMLETESADIRSMKDLVAMESGMYRDTERIKIRHKSVTPSASRPGACVDFDVRGTDETLRDSSGAAYQISYIGFACVHPTFPGRIVSGMYSERGPAAKTGNGLSPVARAILESVQLESAPGVGLSAPSLPAT